LIGPRRPPSGDLDEVKVNENEVVRIKIRFVLFFTRTNNQYVFCVLER